MRRRQAFLTALLALAAASAGAQPEAKAAPKAEVKAEVEQRERLLVSKQARTAYLAEVADAARPRATLELAAEIAARAKQVEPAESKGRRVAAPSGLRYPATRDESEVRQLYGDAVELYVQAAEQGSPREAAYAYNEIGNLHLTMGDTRQAVAAFAQVDLDAVPETQRFVYRFNRARALEQSGEEQRAWSDYLAVLAERPAFRPAVEAAWRTLAAAPADDREAAARAERLVRVLLAEGQHKAVAEILWPALERWRSPGLFALLAEWWTAAPPGDGTLPAAERRRLRALGTPLADELAEAFDAAPFSRAARAASGGDMKRLWHLARERFPAWRETGHGAALAALLTRLADDDRRRGDPGPALARTFVAWWLDRANTEAAADCAAVLAAHPALDPQGEITRELVDVIVEDKGRAYAARDWQNALRMHLLLAGIFEQREIWGSSDELRSAIFQLEHALEAERRLRQNDAEYVASPGLHRRLGEAYAAVGDRDGSCKHYFIAADALKARDRLDEASALTERCSW